MLDWTISYGPLTIGDAESLPAVNFTHFDPMTMPEIRTNDVTLIQRDGLWAGDDYIGGRTVSLALEVQGNSPEEFSSAINLINRAFSPGVSGESPLSFQIPGLCNGRSAYVNVRTRKRSAPLDASFARLYCAFEIELYATDPILYATDETSVTMRKGVVAAVNFEGSRSVAPMMNFVNVTNPKITNVETGLVVSRVGSGTWSETGPNYAPGTRYMVLSDSGTNPAGTATYKWRDTWV